MKKIFFIFVCLALSTIVKSEEENRNINYYYANGIPYYWQDDSTSVNIIVANMNNYEYIVQQLLNIFNEDEVVYDNEDDNIIINSENLPSIDKEELIEQISLLPNDISFFTYSKILENGNHIWLRNELYISFFDTVYFDKIVRPILENYSVVSYNYEGDNEFRIVCDDEWNMMLLANSLEGMEGIKYSTPDFYSEANLNYDDTYYADQWGTHTRGGTYNIKANAAWEFIENNSYGVNENIKVAVIDDGVEEHEDFYYDEGVCKILDGYTANGNGTGRPLPKNWHGQCCAGIIGAVHNNIGVAGIAPKSLIIPFRIVKNREETKYFSSKRVAKAITKAWYDYGADVLSCSWDIGPYSPITDAINKAYTKGRNGKGCVVVFSSGNGGDSVSFPAKLETVISVGAIDKEGNRLNGSNFGSQLDVVAPGYEISTTDRGGDYGCNPNEATNDYEDTKYTKNFSGTSAACPHVSGLAALMLSVNPNLKASHVKNIIEQTAQKIQENTTAYRYSISSAHPNGKWNKQLGYGLVDAYEAVRKAMDVDLYIKDSLSDDGIPPSNITYMWNSPDIWIEDVQTQERINEVESGKIYHVCVRIHNRSDIPSIGTERITINWAKAGVNLPWPSGWDGSTELNCGENPPMSGYIVKEKNISRSIPVGSSYVVKEKWTVPNTDDYNCGIFETEGKEGKWHFCLLAQVHDSKEAYPNDDIGDFVTRNNNVAWKNITVIEGHHNKAIVWFQNHLKYRNNFKFRFSSPLTLKGEKLISYSELFIVLDPKTFNSWIEGGRKGEGIEDAGECRIRIIDLNATIDNINLEPNAIGKLETEIHFLAELLPEDSIFTFDISMYDEKGETLYGGEHYEVIRDPERVFDVKALEDQVVMPETPITFNAVNIGEPATYVWYNTAGDSIASGTTLNTTATQSQQYRLSVQATADGYKGYDTVSVVVRNGAITAITPNPATNQAVVSYTLSNQVQNGTIQIANNNGIVLQSIPFTNAQTSTTLNLQNLVAGQYSVRLVSGIGEVLDTKTLIVQ